MTRFLVTPLAVLWVLFAGLALHAAAVNVGCALSPTPGCVAYQTWSWEVPS